MACIDIHHLSSRSRSGCLLPINLAEGELFDLARSVVGHEYCVGPQRAREVVISNVRPFGSQIVESCLDVFHEGWRRSGG